MESKSIDHDVSANKDILRFGLAGVKGDIVGSHPLESLHKTTMKTLQKANLMFKDLNYGSAFNLKMDLDKQILTRFQRPPGMISSSMIGLEALTGGLEEFTFEDCLDLPQDRETFCPPDLHHGMEVRLNLSQGSVCRSFS